MKRKIILASLLMIVTMLMPYSVSGDQLADIEDAGKIIFGSDTTYPPFEFISEDTDKPTGFSVDLGIIIAEELGVTAAFKSSAWDPIIPNLNNEEFDAILSSMTITTERAQQIDFSNPYFNSSQAILVKEGNPKGVNSEADLQNAGVVVGVQLGTTSDAYITDSGKSESEIVRTEGFNELYPKLDLDEIDVILGDAPVVGYAAATGEVGGELIGTFGDVEPFGIGIRQGETALLGAINDALDAIFADGSFDDVAECWFDFRPLNTSGSASSCDFGTAEYVTEESDTPFNTLAFLVGLGVVTTIVSIRRRK